MRMRTRMRSIPYRLAILGCLGIALALRGDIQMVTIEEQDQVLPFVAVDRGGRAVTDLKKAEIILLVNGLNFRGFSLLSPAGSSFNSRAQAFPELAQSPPGAYYEVVFPYVWESGQEIRLQLGTSRPGVQVTAPASIQKRRPLSAIENLRAEIQALDLLRENTWLNMELASLNLDAASGGSPGKPTGIYDVRLPASLLNDRVDLFKITLPGRGQGLSLQQQWVASDAERLAIERGGETFLLLVDRQKAAALVLRNAPPGSEPQARLTPEESAPVAAAIAERRLRLAALQNESRSIPVERLNPLAMAGSAGGEPSPPAAAESGRTPAAPGPAAPVPVLPGADVRSPALKALDSYCSSLTKTAKIHYCEAALKCLRQNQLAKALPLLAQSLDELTPGYENAAALLSRLKRLHGFLGDTAGKAKSLAGTDLRQELDRLQTAAARDPGKDGGREFFTGLKEVLDNAQEGPDLAREVLARLPQHLGPGEESTASGRFPAAGVPALLELTERYLAAAGEIAARSFIAEGWLVRVMGDLRQILTRTPRISETAERCLSLLPDSLSETAIGFVMANSRSFTPAFKRSFYARKLLSLGISAAWLGDPSFADVVLQAQALQRNGRGFWEASFADDLIMIFIPPGSFTMGVPWESGGAEDESPPHQVELGGYWIAKTEVTFAHFDRFCEESGRLLPSDFGKGRKKKPVIGISYQDAIDFCLWLRERTGAPFRLPTEAEWERAARGDGALKYPWGSAEPNGMLANFADANFLEYYRKANPPANEAEKEQMLQWIAGAADDGFIFTAPVGSFPTGASPCGALDMAGNVWEWVSDWYDGNYYQGSPPRNPRGSPSGIYRVVRGGGWDCNPWMLRSTTRSGAPPVANKGSESVGFRVAAGPLHETSRQPPDPGSSK